MFTWKKRVWGWPKTLRNKLFLTFLLFILLPFALLYMYFSQEIKQMMQERIISGSGEELKKMNGNLEDFMGTASKTVILLEQDPDVAAILTAPASYHELERRKEIEAKMKSINNSIFLTSPRVFYTITDNFGNVYASFRPKEALDYKALVEQTKRLFSAPGKPFYHWDNRGENYIHPDESDSPYLLTLYTQLRDRLGAPYGYIRISLDYNSRFETMYHDSSPDQLLYILDEHGKPLSKYGNDHSVLQSSWMERAGFSPEASGFFIDDPTSSIIMYSYVPQLQWYLVNQVSYDTLFRELNGLSKRFLLIFLVLAALFLLIMYIVSKTITNPLLFMQSRMAEVVRRNLKVHVPEHRFQGEMLAVTQSFNQMITDMNEMVRHMKAEERQKEAMRFQILLSQMNPHFLFNSLNTVKWIAIREKNETIKQITLALGKMLETSMRIDVDLIHFYKEIELLKSYVYIQKLRYDNRFDVHYEFDDVMLHTLVPKFFLQPLVENCIQHGFSQNGERGEIWIRLAREGGKLRVEVEDNGVGMEQAAASSRQETRGHGIALENLKERLNLLFKKESSVEIWEGRSGKGTLVAVVFPLLLSAPYQTEGEEAHVDGYFG